ncbi:MAG: polyprenyl synthetase family protein, partial [Yoonia sp.]
WTRTFGKGRQEDGDLEHAIALLAKHGTMETTRQTALDYVAQAKNALALLPDTDIREMLIDLADYVVARIT